MNDRIVSLSTLSGCRPRFSVLQLRSLPSFAKPPAKINYEIDEKDYSCYNHRTDFYPTLSTKSLAKHLTLQYSTKSKVELTDDQYAEYKNLQTTSSSATLNYKKILLDRMCLIKCEDDAVGSAFVWALGSEYQVQQSAISCVFLVTNRHVIQNIHFARKCSWQFNQGDVNVQDVHVLLCMTTFENSATHKDYAIVAVPLQEKHRRIISSLEHLRDIGLLESRCVVPFADDELTLCAYQRTGGTTPEPVQPIVHSPVNVNGIISFKCNFALGAGASGGPLFTSAGEVVALTFARCVSTCSSSSSSSSLSSGPMCYLADVVNERLVHDSISILRDQQRVLQLERMKLQSPDSVSESLNRMVDDFVNRKYRDYLETGHRPDMIPDDLELLAFDNGLEFEKCIQGRYWEYDKKKKGSVFLYKNIGQLHKHPNKDVAFPPAIAIKLHYKRNAAAILDRSSDFHPSQDTESKFEYTDIHVHCSPKMDKAMINNLNKFIQDLSPETGLQRHYISQINVRHAKLDKGKLTPEPSGKPYDGKPESDQLKPSGPRYLRPISNKFYMTPVAVELRQQCAEILREHGDFELLLAKLSDERKKVEKLSR